MARKDFRWDARALLASARASLKRLSERENINGEFLRSLREMEKRYKEREGK